MQATLLINPKAGNTASVETLDLQNLLYEAGFSSEHRPTENETDLDTALQDPGDLVVAVGGDGTLRAVATRLAGKGVPLVLVPMGTANNIGNALGLVRNPQQILSGLQQPRRQTFDLGRLRGPWGEDYFLEGAGTGLFAATLATYDPEEGKNPLRALTATVQTLSGYQPQEIKVWLDGEEQSQTTVLLEVMNTPAIGPRLRLAPNADPGDGWLDVVVVNPDQQVGFTTYLNNLLQGKFDDLPNVNVNRCRKVELEWNGSPFHCDGEVRSDETLELPQHIEIEVWPAALELWLPAESVAAKEASVATI